MTNEHNVLCLMVPEGGSMTRASAKRLTRALERCRGRQVVIIDPRSMVKRNFTDIYADRLRELNIRVVETITVSSPTLKDIDHRPMERPEPVLRFSRDAQGILTVFYDEESQRYVDMFSHCGKQGSENGLLMVPMAEHDNLSQVTEFITKRGLVIPRHIDFVDGITDVEYRLPYGESSVFYSTRAQFERFKTVNTSDIMNKLTRFNLIHSSGSTRRKRMYQKKQRSYDAPPKRTARRMELKAQRNGDPYVSAKKYSSTDMRIIAAMDTKRQASAAKRKKMHAIRQWRLARTAKAIHTDV